MKYIFNLLFISMLSLTACTVDTTPNFIVPPPGQEEPKEEAQPDPAPEQTPEQSPEQTPEQPGDQTPDQPGNTEQTPQQPVNPEGMPVMLGTRTEYKVDVEELSGICFTLDKSAMWSCGDQGVVKLISLADFTATEVWVRDADMEDITIDPRTGDLYIALEYSQKVYKLSAPDYNKHETIIYVQEAIDKKYDNSGLEGIAYYKDDMLFIGSQWGANLWIYKLDGTMVSKVSLESFADEVAGLCYDPVADWLWVVDSNMYKAYICTVDGQHLATYELGSVDNAESICVDRDNNCVWIGSDEGSPKLYKYDFKF